MALAQAHKVANQRMWSIDPLAFKRIFFISTALLLLIGGRNKASNDLVVSDGKAENILKSAKIFRQDAIKRADELLSILPEIGQSMLSFYEIFDSFEQPLPILLDDKVQAWKVPLYSAKEKKWASLIISDRDNSVLSVPNQVNLSINKMENRFITLSSSFFNPPKEGFSLIPDFPFLCEKNKLRIIYGHPTNPLSIQGKMIDDWDFTPANMHEKQEIIHTINEEYKPEPPWQSIPGIRQTPFKCLFYATSFASNIMGKRQKKNIGSYRSIFNGQIEEGINPRILESLYDNRAYLNPDAAYAPPLIFKDLITQSKIACNLDLMSQILINDLPEKIADSTLKGLEYQVPKWLSGLFNHYEKLEIEENAIKKAIDDNQIIIGGWIHKIQGLPLYASTHFSLIGGYYFVGDCLYVVFAEPYGNYPIDKDEDGEGGPMWRFLPYAYLGEAIILKKI